jgi:hypothetical protein
VIQQDRSIADLTVGSWAVQLGALKDSGGAVSRLSDLRTSGYTDAILVSSNDYTSFRYPDYYVIILPRTFSAAADANAWADSQNFAPNDAFAKRLSHTDSWEGNNVDR